MSSAPLIPQVSWFRLGLVCPRCDDVPRSGPGRKLLDLPDGCILPAPVQLEGRTPWAELRAAWNPRGLAVAVAVAGRSAQRTADGELVEGVQLWIDTRDTRDIHRATRYCHRFRATLAPAPGAAPEVLVAQVSIHRAQADAPRARPGAIQARAGRSRTGWLLELFLAAEALHGFDPETNRRLGFMAVVGDPQLGEQFLGAGREFPVETDPSLWPTLELREPG
jgi:hypothetical protein